LACLRQKTLLKARVAVHTGHSTFALVGAAAILLYLAMVWIHLRFQAFLEFRVPAKSLKLLQFPELLK
jgi:hypothetical protein